MMPSLIDFYFIRLREHKHIKLARNASFAVEIGTAVLLCAGGIRIYIFRGGSTSTIIALILIGLGYCTLWSLVEQFRLGFRHREMERYFVEVGRATRKQLVLLNDVCPICHDEMKMAVVTICKHFYHRACLQEWISVHSICPKCYRPFDLLDSETPIEKGILMSSIPKNSI